MRKVLVLCGLLAAGVGLFPVEAGARPLEKEFPPYTSACFMRDFDVAFLLKNPDQGVVQMMLSRQPSMTHGSNPGDPFYVKIKMMVRGSTRVYEYGANCEASDHNGASLQCEPEWEAGNFSITAGKNGSIIIHNNRMVFNPPGYRTKGIGQGAITLTRDSEWELLPSSRCFVRKVRIPRPSADSSLPEEHYVEPYSEPLAPEPMQVQPEPLPQAYPDTSYPGAEPVAPNP